MNKSFNIVGVSRLAKNEPFKLRVANGKIAVRKRILERNGHSDIELFELPNSMDKAAAEQWLRNAKPALVAQLKAKDKAKSAA